jgi:putative Mn2+ efflux pump MntP
MIYGALKLGPEEKPFDPLNVVVLLVLSIATSIDALAVGVSLSFLSVPIAAPVLVIGGVTFAVCLAGVYIGNRFGHWFESRIEVAGGVVLILIGVQILVKHLTGA